MIWIDALYRYVWDEMIQWDLTPNICSNFYKDKKARNKSEIQTNPRWSALHGFLANKNKPGSPAKSKSEHIFLKNKNQFQIRGANTTKKGTRLKRFINLSNCSKIYEDIARDLLRFIKCTRFIEWFSPWSNPLPNRTTFKYQYPTHEI